MATKINTVAKMHALDIADEIVDAVREATANGEDGITFKQAVEITGLGYHHLYQAIHELDRMGRVMVAHRSDRITRFIVLPDWEPPAKLELTDLQQRALDYLVSVADEDGIAYASYGEIAGRPGRGRHGGTYFTVETLDKKGYLSILLRGKGARRTLFQVYPDGDGPLGYSPFSRGMIDAPAHLGIPAPADFASWAQNKTAAQAIEKYGRSAPVVRRWFAEVGIEPYKPKRPDKKSTSGTPTLVYPFLVRDRGTPEHILIRRVNEVVPQWLPPDRRADICQDLIVAILCGDISEDTLDLSVKDFTRQILKQFPTHFGDLSLDAPIPGTDGLTLLDTLPSDFNPWEEMGSRA